jgi:hypothetical protein
MGRSRLHEREKPILRDVANRYLSVCIAELAGGGIVGVEVNASTAPKRDAARHLTWLREELGDRFVARVVLHTGPRVYTLDERIVAAPICTLWA